jgi:flavin reductase (DIM6/NTAB) family NADH-FMN oxidoreductase RutF
MMLDAHSFRAVLGRFASGITVITARDAIGRDHGMTVSAFSALSLDPPLVLCCIDRAASFHPTIAAAEHFAVNVLAAGQEALSRRFAETTDDRFDGVGFTRGQTGAALLDDTLAWLECRVAARHAGGDHTIVVGVVEAAGAREHRPLLYYRGGYANLEH